MNSVDIARKLARKFLNASKNSLEAHRLHPYKDVIVKLREDNAATYTQIAEILTAAKTEAGEENPEVRTHEVSAYCRRLDEAGKKPIPK